MRLQYDIDGSLEKRFRRYCPEAKMRHLYAREALEEWVNRREGRDKKFQIEKLAADKRLLIPVIKEMIEAGDIEIVRSGDVRA